MASKRPFFVLVSWNSEKIHEKRPVKAHEEGPNLGGFRQDDMKQDQDRGVPRKTFILPLESWEGRATLKEISVDLAKICGHEAIPARYRQEFPSISFWRMKDFLKK